MFSSTLSYFSVLQENHKVQLQKRGGRPGHRINSHKDGRDKVEENQGFKEIGKSWNKAKETHLLVATLIAPVTFAAGFTMPGGYQSAKGLDHGAIVLSRSAAFKAFVIMDTIAVAVSSCSLLVLLYSSVYTNPNYENEISDTFFMVVSLILWALIAMVVSFITGTYAVLDGRPFSRTCHSGFCVWLLFLLCLGKFPSF